jgi:hypothetical protein
MQQKPLHGAGGFKRSVAVPIGAFATTAALLLAGLPAAAEGSVIAPEVVKPEPVTPHVVPPSPSPADPATPPAAAPASSASDPTAPSAIPEAAPSTAANVSAPSSSPTPGEKPKTPGDKQKELLAELRTALGFAPVPVIPEPTPHWSVFDRVMAIVAEYFCPRFTWQGATANVENTHEGGECF